MPELGLAGPSGADYICAKKIQSYFRLRRRLSREHTDQGCCLCLCGMADQRTSSLLCVFARLLNFTHLAHGRIWCLALVIGSGSRAQIGKVDYANQTCCTTFCSFAYSRSIFPYSSCRPNRFPMYEAIPTYMTIFLNFEYRVGSKPRRTKKPRPFAISFAKRRRRGPSVTRGKVSGQICPMGSPWPMLQC
jgi:hypothetical protein